MTQPATSERSSPADPVTTPTWPVVVALLLVVAVVDLFQSRLDLPRALFGLLDEAGHLATTWLLLAGAAVLAGRRWPAAVLLGAGPATVLVDLDHVPLELFGSDVLMRGGSRPVTHSLLTVAVLLATAAVLRGRAGQVAAGAGLGVLTHLWRDLATAPVPVLWPSPSEVFLGPVPVWGSLVVASAVLVLGRRRPARQP